MPRTVGLAEFPPPSARWSSPPLKAAENASPGRSRRGRRRTDAACRLLLDSRRGNDLFCRISVDGVSREESSVSWPSTCLQAQADGQVPETEAASAPT